MSRIRLTLLREPTLFVGGIPVRITPRSSFEVLALIIAAPGGSISRKEVSEAVWPHLDSSSRAAQLRIALSKLRSELERIGLSGSFDLGTKRLEQLESVSTDFDILQASQCGTLEELMPFCQPVAPGWTSERWREFEDMYSNALAEQYMSVGHRTTTGGRGENLSFLRAAAHHYPTSVFFHVELLRYLDAQGAKSEALQQVIAFEDAWVDRFGSGDVPDLWAELAASRHLTRQPLSPQDESAEESAPLPKAPDFESAAHRGSDRLHRRSLPSIHGSFRSKRTLWLGFSALLLIPLAGVLFRLPRSAPLSDLETWEGDIPPIRSALDEEPGRIWIRDGGTFSVGNHAVRRWELVTYRSEFRSFTRTADGRYILDLYGYGDRWLKKILWNPGVSRRELKERELVTDLLGNQSLRQESIHIMAVQSGATTRRYAGNKTFPRVLGGRFLQDGRVIAFRHCDHLFGCHRYPIIIDGDRIEEIKPVPDAQVTVTDFVKGDFVFGKYSRGKADGWRYTPWVFDLKNKKLKILSGAPILDVSSRGIQLRRPEKTDVVKGDYRTYPTNEVVFVSPNGKSRKLNLAGTDRFPLVGRVGDLVVVDASNGGLMNLRAIGYDGEPIPSVQSNLRNPARLEISQNGDSILVGHTRLSPDWYRCSIWEVVPPTTASKKR